MQNALAGLKQRKCDGLCKAALKSVQEIANQGVYLLDAEGDVIDCAVPSGLNLKKRIELTPTLHERPYFRIAKSFREPFVSDSFPSIFNANSTIFLCVPITEENRFSGLLFAATQIGPWKLPVELAQSQWRKHRSFLMVDSQGICLLPPNNELQTEDGMMHHQLNDEDKAANRGFHYRDLFALSRRDSLIKHVVEGIVPLSQDDDVFDLSSDFEYYIVVTEIRRTRWKLAIAEPNIRTSHLSATASR
jgi:hypothetical protein